MRSRSLYATKSSMAIRITPSTSTAAISPRLMRSRSFVSDTLTNPAASGNLIKSFSKRTSFVGVCFHGDELARRRAKCAKLSLLIHFESEGERSA